MIGETKHRLWAIFQRSPLTQRDELSVDIDTERHHSRSSVDESTSGTVGKFFLAARLAFHLEK